MSFTILDEENVEMFEGLFINVEVANYVHIKDISPWSDEAVFKRRSVLVFGHVTVIFLDVPAFIETFQRLFEEKGSLFTDETAAVHVRVIIGVA